MMQDPRLVGNVQPPPYDINSTNGIPPEFFALHQLYVEQMSAYMRNWNMYEFIIQLWRNQSNTYV